MKSALVVGHISLALILALGAACGQDQLPTVTPSTPVPPTNTPAAEAAAVSNIPLPTRAPISTPTSANAHARVA